MLIKLHGKFAHDYGTEYRIEADTVADAIEGLTRQIGFYGDLPLDDRPITRVVGFDTEESLYEKTEQEVVHLVPAMIGGGGSVGRILIGAALIGLAFTPLGAITLAGHALAPILIGMGAGMVLGGAMQLFMGQPNISKSKDPDASKYLGIGDNTVAIGTPIALQWGRGPATGHVLAINVDSSEMMFGSFPANPT